MPCCQYWVRYDLSMKFKILAILLFSVLVYLNPQVKTYAADSSTILENLNNTEDQLSSIVLESQNSLENIDINLKSFNQLIVIFNNFKQYDIKFAEYLANKVKQHDTLSGEEIYFLRRLITTYYKINQKFLDFSQLYDLGGFKMASAFAELDKNIPNIKAHLIWLAGHLLVLDHLEVMHTIFYETDNKFRRIVKSALLDNGEDETDSKTLNDLIKINKYTVDIGESKKFSQQINLVRLINSDLNNFFATDLDAMSLLQEIDSNQTAQDIARGKAKFHESTFTFVDTIYNIVNKTIGWFSKIFGNWAGSIHSRHGHLYNNTEAINMAEANLKPMDIILDKSPFVLTDKFIPGYFGHVAIYLGTKQQLEEIGMWNHPDILPYQQEIESGKIILEAVREGVHLNTLENFMNIDQLLIIRKSEVLDNKELLFDKINRGLTQIGKNYDFNFDISTLDTIVCSELIYIVFGNVHWSTEYRFGRPTITPDNIAEIIFQKNTKFNTQVYILSTDDKTITNAGPQIVAENLDYELRTSTGLPIQDKDDASNSYWKKITKCHSVMTVNNHRDSSIQATKRVCETSYNEYNYEEK